MTPFVGCRVKCNTHRAIGPKGQIIDPGVEYGRIVNREYSQYLVGYENQIYWDSGVFEWYSDRDIQSFLDPTGVDVMVYLA